MRRIKELEFMQLKQRNMSLGEYASKFEELQKYYTFFYHPYFESSQTNKPKYFGPQPNKKKYNEKKPYNLFQ